MNKGGGEGGTFGGSEAGICPACYVHCLQIPRLHNAPFRAPTWHSIVEMKIGANLFWHYGQPHRRGLETTSGDTSGK